MLSKVVVKDPKTKELIGVSEEGQEGTNMHVRDEPQFTIEGDFLDDEGEIVTFPVLFKEKDETKEAEVARKADHEARFDKWKIQGMNALFDFSTKDREKKGKKSKKKLKASFQPGSGDLLFEDGNRWVRLGARATDISDVELWLFLFALFFRC